MTWLKGANAPLALLPSCASDCDLKKVLSVLIIANEVPVAILYVYIPIP